MDIFVTKDPELYLLALLSRKELNSAMLKEIKAALANNINWERFYRLLIKNRVYPTMSSNLVLLDNTAFAEKYTSKVRALIKNNSLLSLKQQAQLKELLTAFADKGIRVITLKGIPLSIYLYGDTSFRMSRDIDILVDSKDIGKAEEALLSLSYKSEDLSDGLSPKQRANLLAVSHHLSYAKNGMHVELHWRFAKENKSFSFDNLWKHKRSMIINGQDVYVLSLEDDFLYLLYHGIKHGFHRFKWLLDLIEILCKDELDWKMVKTKANGEHLMEALGVLDILAYYFYSIPVSIETPKNKKIKKIAKYSLEIMKLELEELSTIKKKYDISRTTSLKERIVFVLMHFRPGIIDYKTVKIDDKYHFLYYPLRSLLKIHRILKKVI